MPTVEELKQKYQSVFRLIEQHQVRLQNVHMEGNKLLIRGEAPTQDAKDRVWDQIKLVNPALHDVIADITVAAGGAASAPQAGGQTYTVKSGDTLSKIAQQFYGDPNQYLPIFDANRDQLSDPDKIKPGQQLVIPPKAA